MAWIRFNPDGRRAPSMPLQDLQGEEREVADFYGRSNLAVFFSHGAGCASCCDLVERFAAHASDLRLIRSQVLVILPSGSAPSGALTGGERVHLLLDPEDDLCRRYEARIEEDTAGQAMLFILDSYGVPYVAWVGSEPGEDVYDEAMEWLEFIAIQCPE
jgi:peroxiredoxin